LGTIITTWPLWLTFALRAIYLWILLSVNFFFLD
jgi:hypothetical protein